MTKFHNHYESLNVTRDAPAEVIRAAYRSLSQKHHPDKNFGDHDAAQMMMRLNTAYGVLSDPEQRELHDLQIQDEQLARASGRTSDMPDERLKDQVASLFRHLRSYAKGRNMRVSAALLGGFSVVFIAIMWTIWKDNQSALLLERAAFYGTPPGSGSLAAAEAVPASPAPDGASTAKAATERPKPAAALKPPVAPAAASKASEYERLTAMLKSMGFGLHKLDAPAQASRDAPRLPVKAAEAAKESAAPPAPAPAAKAVAPTDTGRPREEMAGPVAADPVRGEAKPVAVASPALAPAAASLSAASASHPLRTAVLADARACPPPPYPLNAFRNGESGTVLLALLIGSDGRVLESKVQKSSGSSELDKAARKALSLCKFKPASNDAQAEPAWTNLSYVWSID